MSKRRYALQFIGFILILSAIWYFSGKLIRLNSAALENYLKHFPIVYSSVIYIVTYVIITFFIFLSKDVFWLAGAVIFGVKLSAILITIAEIINAFILFHIARKFGRTFVEKKTPEKYRYLDEKIGSVNFGWLVILRAAPLVPYRFMDLAAGLTKIDFRRYLAAVVLGTPIKMFWIQYVLFGVGKNILTNPDLLVKYFLHNKVMLGVGLIYLLLVILVVIKIKPKEKRDDGKH